MCSLFVFVLLLSIQSFYLIAFNSDSQIEFLQETLLLFFLSLFSSSVSFSLPLFSSADRLSYVNVFHHSGDLPGLPEHVIAFLSLPLALSLICPGRPPLPTSLSSHLRTSCWLFDRPPGRVLHRNLSCSLSSSESSDMRSRHKSA